MSAVLSPRYSLYGSEMQGIGHAALLAEQKEHGLLLARAENSGCEGCYVEVAKWSDKARRWERYAFVKLFDGDAPDDSEATCFQLCDQLSAEINAAGCGAYESLIHHLPNYSSGKKGKVSA